jgi:NAD(P)-dependent dehydrogenase (short-subunit alcohol dehydrogenase family)
LKAPLFLSRDFSKQIKKDSPGLIINIIDQRIFFPNPEFISYTSSKQSLMWLTQTLAQALSPQIRVCAIGPGPTLQGARQSKKDFENQSLSTPLMIGSNPEEIYRAVKFIIDMPSFTGQMITLDGGEHLDWIKKENKNFKD